MGGECLSRWGSGCQDCRSWHPSHLSSALSITWTHCRTGPEAWLPGAWVSLSGWGCKACQPLPGLWGRLREVIRVQVLVFCDGPSSSTCSPVHFTGLCPWMKAQATSLALPGRCPPPHGAPWTEPCLEPPAFSLKGIRHVYFTSCLVDTCALSVTMALPCAGCCGAVLEKEFLPLLRGL